MHDEDLKKVFWVFNSFNFKTIPSYFVAGVLPSNYLESPKLVFLEEHDPEQTLDNINAKILILFKAFDKGLVALAKSAKRRGIKIVSVFDDWYLENIERTNFNLPLAELSDLIVVKTKVAALEIKNHFKINALVIPDSIRFKKNKIFKNNNKKLDLCWFGTRNNHDTLISELKKIEILKIPVRINVVTNLIDELKKDVADLNIKNHDIRYKAWHENANLDIVESEIVILPYTEDVKRLVKSSNRIIDSLNLGRFTIMSPVSQFREFKDFVYYGDICEGIRWFKDNKELAKQITLKGQKYVDKNYSIEFISNKWKKILLKML